MRKLSLSIVLIFSVLFSIAQTTDSSSVYSNIATKLMNSDSRLTIGGYGEVHYNQSLNSDVKNLGKLDVHRMVMLFGYKFNERTKFVTELEFEHVKEVYVEQAFLDYRINSFLNLRAGLMLVPMGIVNEYHEPTTFFGVERPLIDGAIAPTTWREIGIGLTGNIASASFKYQAYVMNGFNGYTLDDGGKFKGSNGLRSGRQKGAESYMSSPTIAARAEYYGIRGLNIGASGYFGKSQSELFGGIDMANDSLVAIADSSVINIAMLGIDARYTFEGLYVRGQFYLTKLGNTDQYNTFTAKIKTDAVTGVKTNEGLGNTMIGYYAEVGYNVLKTTSYKSELIPFIRYSNYNMHASVENGFSKNKAYNINAITAGIGWKMARGAMFKADMQFYKNEATDEYSKTINAGVAVMF
ncbi:MAG: hypothetical protein JEZ09_06805 [Salinivirgaceae bacterium]|nr:hypothetical protein [Salinivirgaceae bacterium]